MRLSKIKIFEIKDLDEASFVLSIEIRRERSRGMLRLSQRSYIDHFPRRFNMHNCLLEDDQMVKVDKFSKSQCPKNKLEKEAMRQILMHLQSEA